MPVNDDDDDGMGELAARTARRVDEELSELEAALLRESGSNLDHLQVIVSNPEAFAELVAAVNQATRQNEDIAAFGRRIKSLGKEVVNVAKTIVKLV